MIEREEEVVSPEATVKVENDIVQNEAIKHAADFKSPPSVALHLLAKNAESVIGRLLANVGPYLSEVVVALNDTSDDTKKILESWGREHGKRVDITEVTAESHPDLYILDTQSTYDVGRSLCGENFMGPFTEQPILADWSGIRNLAWEKCEADWRLFMDADDEMEDPEAIWGICASLAEHRADLALSKYAWAVNEDGRPRGASYRERIARNIPEIRWIYPIHEVIHGHMRHAFIDGNLRVTDHRDSSGEGIRIPGRNFKILYEFARRNDWEISSRMMLQLAEAGRPMPEFVRESIRVYLTRSSWGEERGWAFRLLGETYEAEEEWSKASACYVDALAEHPGTKAAFALCRSRYHEGLFTECAAAYEEGMRHSQIMQLVDDGPLYMDMSKILVADALYRLGAKEKAIALVKVAREAFPKCEPLKVLEEEMIAGKPPRPLHPEVSELAEEAADEAADEVSP
jgi:tetratricopeptide (TPR) repeat protein